jgi:hypothetical protein
MHEIRAVVATLPSQIRLVLGLLVLTALSSLHCKSGCDLTGYTPTETIVRWSASSPIETTSDCQIARPDSLVDDQGYLGKWPVYSDVIRIHANIGDQVTLDVSDGIAFHSYNGLCESDVEAMNQPTSATYCGYGNAGLLVLGCDVLVSASEPVQLVTSAPQANGASGQSRLSQHLVFRVTGYGVVHLVSKAAYFDMDAQAWACVQETSDAGVAPDGGSDAGFTIPGQGLDFGIMTIVPPGA